ncbi:hypothetical protein AKJ16_DCAP15491 [Drosera capensis]
MKFLNPRIPRSDEFYERWQNSQGRMEFIRVTKGVIHMIAPTYYLTIEVSYIGVAERMLFQAKVRNKSRMELMLFREVRDAQQEDFGVRTEVGDLHVGEAREIPVNHMGIVEGKKFREIWGNS